jgi:hypothetical protein
VPFAARNAQSNTGRCSGFSPGAPSMVSSSSMYSTIAFVLAVVVAELAQRLGDRVVDDLDHAAADQPLVLDERDVGLDAVVSQSIMKPMVPVGASTVAWPLR